MAVDKESLEKRRAEHKQIITGLGEAIPCDQKLVNTDWKSPLEHVSEVVPVLLGKVGDSEHRKEASERSSLKIRAESINCIVRLAEISSGKAAEYIHSLQ